jgi:hypothetical protein
MFNIMLAALYVGDWEHGLKLRVANSQRDFLITDVVVMTIQVYDYCIAWFFVLLIVT